MNVVFLDRDGTVITEPPDGRVTSIDKVKLFPDTIEALHYLAENDVAVVFITNQACIADGYLTEPDFWKLHDEILKLLEPSHVNVLKTYMNPDSAGTVNEWRKPGPRMILQAAEDLNIDIGSTYMVGDRETDVQTAINAGCKGGVFIDTTKTNSTSPIAVYNATSLLDAVRYLVTHA